MVNLGSFISLGKFIAVCGVLLLMSCGTDEGFDENTLVVPTGYLRFVHTLSEGPEFIVEFDNQLISGFNFGDVSADQVINPLIDTDLTFSYFDETGIQEISTITVNVDIDHTVTVIVTGTLAKPQLLVIDQSTDINDLDVNVVFAHGAAFAFSGYDFYITQGTEPLGEPIALLNQYEASSTLSLIPASDYRLRVVAPNSTNVVWDSGLFSVEIEKNLLFVLHDGFGPDQNSVKVLPVTEFGTVVFDESQNGAVRFSQMVADEEEGVDYYLDGNLVVNSLSFQSVTGFQNSETGLREITVTSSSDPEDVIVESTFTIEPGTYHTVSLIGTMENSSLDVISEDYRRISDRASLVLSHFSSSEGNVDARIVPAGSSLADSLLLSLVFGTSNKAVFLPDSYEIYLTEVGTDDIVGGPFRINMQSGGLYRLYLTDQMGGGGPTLFLPGDDLNPSFNLNSE